MAKSSAGNVRRAGVWLVAMVGFTAASSAMVARPASAADGACSIVDAPTVGRLFGPAGAPLDTIVGGQPACRVTANGTLTLDVIDTRGGSDEFTRQLATHPSGSAQAISGYVDGAFFGWGVNGALDFVARRGDQTTTLRLTGTDTRSNFDANDPQASAPGGDLSGSQVGSSMWVLMTDVFSRDTSIGVPATVDDLSGLWRTADITPCAPQGQLGVRVSRFTDDGGALRSAKVAGDSCLANASTDFEGSTTGGRGTGQSFGGLGTSIPGAGTPYELTVASPTSVSLTGQAGTLRYTLEYERLSWPGLSPLGNSSSLLGIPSPSEALTVKNVALTGVLSVLLLLMVVLPTTLFNSALEANLDHYRLLVARIRARLRARVPGADGRVSFWRRPRGMAIYIVSAGLLFSLMQPGWGPNSATLVSFIGFVGAVVVTSVFGMIATRTYLSFRYKQGTGHTLVEPFTLGIAALFVLASRLVGFLPGYMYGVLVGWESTHGRDEYDRGRIVAFGSAIAFIAAVVAWLLIPVCRTLGAPRPNAVESMPLSIVGGVFVSCTEALTIGLIPLHFLPGKLLRNHNRRLWMAMWGGGGFLFVLVLLRPGVVSGASRNVWGTCLLALVSSVLAVIFWLTQRNRDRQVMPATASIASVPPLPPLPPPSVSTELRPSPPPPPMSMPPR